jgi:hypothetical protein
LHNYKAKQLPPNRELFNVIRRGLAMSEESKRIDTMRGAHETERQRVIREIGLSHEEVARITVMRAGDEISMYAGNFALQARMMVDRRGEIAEREPTQHPMMLEEHQDTSFSGGELDIPSNIFEGMGTE